MKRKSSAILISISFFIVLSIILFGYSNIAAPIATKTLKIIPDQEIINQFSYEDTSEIADFSANLTLYIEELKSPGRLRININDFYYGYVDIDSEGYLNITSFCSIYGCSTLYSGNYAPIIIKQGENTVKMTSDGFDGEFTYTIKHLS